MVTNAVKWATEKGLVRTNPVHGAKEYRVAVFEKFNNKERDRTATSATVGAEVQDPLYISRFIVDIFQSHDRFTRYISINDKKIYDIYIYIQMIIYIYMIYTCVCLLLQAHAGSKLTGRMPLPFSLMPRT